MTNEQLCIAALDGDTEARNSLVENNMRFIKRTAYEIWSAQQELNAAIGIEISDLVQEGALGLLDCIAGYRPDTGNKFLTYAAPAIRNTMVDYIRSYNPTFEVKNLGNIIRLDEVVKDENRGKHDIIGDPIKQTPEQIYLAQERIDNLYHALDIIDAREERYLRYRFGFDDDIEHTLMETAKHFHLSESRAKSTETLALWIMCGWNCRSGFNKSRNNYIQV